MENIHSAMRPFVEWFAPCRATGNHRVAQNDEPEPGDLTAADLAEIDAFYARADATEPSAAQKAARNDERALELQMQSNARNPQLGGLY